MDTILCCPPSDCSLFCEIATKPSNTLPEVAPVELSILTRYKVPLTPIIAVGVSTSYWSLIFRSVATLFQTLPAHSLIDIFSQKELAELFFILLLFTEFALVRFSIVSSELAPIAVWVPLPKFRLTEPIAPVRNESPCVRVISSVAGNSLNPPPFFTNTSPLMSLNFTKATPLARVMVGVRESTLEIKTRNAISNKRIFMSFPPQPDIFQLNSLFPLLLLTPVELTQIYLLPLNKYHD